ncbi:hypothetical protein B0J13DRAFT_599348 [Dactylonectria estremocensis]|uniref:ubiquitinyl hydrolase 1 n=1 Tax=Dactylonectria estremocensis TaxID=1079267 RepID=A0A9P9DNH7_9HYPO|nr:hypothetical protein B0J13DRAFT_599348 [Dactylonectria estremocensis]
MAPVQESLAGAVFNHLVLPPQLPSAFDGDDVSLIEDLGSRLENACTTLRSLCHSEGDPAWDVLQASIHAARVLNKEFLAKDDLVQAFGDLKDNWLPLYLAKQNAALLIHHDRNSDSVTFEAFEVAAPTSKVLKAKHALAWEFPGRAASISRNEFNEESFQDTLSHFLEQASSEAFGQFAARASKGGKIVVEIRDSARPALITEMLMPLLECIGKPVEVCMVQKRVRDDVVLGSSKRPWRRSPYWLLLRAALRRILSELFNCTESLAPEKTVMLQAKLCRRLAKLDSERTTVLDSKQRVANLWEDYKKKTTRRIPVLPSRVPDKDLRLLLSNSGTALSQLLVQRTKPLSKGRVTSPDVLGEGTVSQLNRMADRVAKLVDKEIEITTQLRSPSADPRQTCVDLARTLRNFLLMPDGAYENDALLMSQHILRLFELWVAMDQAATAACPLLHRYHPVFVAEALDMLCLPTIDEMVRLRDVQQYITGRIMSHSVHNTSIFDDLDQATSFPLRFMTETPDGKDMTSLGERINVASNSARATKSSELASCMSAYNKLSEGIQNGVCCCTRLPNGTKDIRGCKKCWQWRTRKRMKISTHEDYLPHDTAQLAAILFELAAPEYLKAYRMATWKLRLLGTQNIEATRNQPSLLLKQCEQLMRLSGSIQGSMPFTLASQNKAYLQTHYANMQLPKMDSEVLLPFGPHFSYFDTDASIWVVNVRNERMKDTVFPPSSYRIAANASQCPSGMSAQEFSAFQRAVSGRSRRWLVLLVELGATNLNFSNETTMIFLNHFALQAGPMDPNLGAFREVHGWFKDEGFRARLAEQLRNRLNILVSNWREVFCMSAMITLTLRLHNLGPLDGRTVAYRLLLKIREITSDWIVHLRREVRSTTDADTAQKAARYAFWAALLCRQTFSVYLNTPETLINLDGVAVRHFFRASIALQENLLINIDDLPPLLQGFLIRDFSMSYSMRELFHDWVMQSHTALEDAINETWVASESSGRLYSSWSSAPGQPSWWVMAQIAGNQWSHPQVVHYHILQGHLLVDGKPLGRLPLQVREHPSVRDLFQSQHLLTRPSGVAGMEYQLVSSVYGHHIHIGFRGGEVVIRARFRASLLEYVPSGIFKGESDMDLPFGLVEDCVHWLNLDSGTLEIRRKPQIWRSKPSNWILDVRKRLCARRKGEKDARGFVRSGSSLVEPRSGVGKHIAVIFEGFEDVEKLTIYQPLGRNGKLTVEMKRLEIQFHVNYKGLLECPQLASEVDPDQNPGTFHGLASQVVLRSVVNPSLRSLIVPLGTEYTWDRKGMHVVVKVANSGVYSRFHIDTLLGRLDCAQELEILHLKALLHALTSFSLSDKLTGRTGTEEATHCLASACSQPWTPLSDTSKDLLSSLRSLSPKPMYYPEGMRTYQKIERDQGLTMTIQHEILAPPPTHGPSPRRRNGSRTGPETVVVEVLWKRPEELPILAKLAPLFNTNKVIGGFQDSLKRINIQELLGADIVAIWGNIAQTCRSRQSIKYVRLFSLALLALGRNTSDMQLIFWLAALARNTRLREIAPPRATGYSEFQVFETPSKEALTTRILKFQPSYDKILSTLPMHRTRSAGSIPRLGFERRQKAEAGIIAQDLVKKWPSAPSTVNEFRLLLSDSNSDYVDMTLAWKGLQLEMERLTRNHQLSCYLKQFQDIADDTPLYKLELDQGTSKSIQGSMIEKSPDSSTLTRDVFRVPELETGLALKPYRQPCQDLDSHPIVDSDSDMSSNSSVSTFDNSSLDISSLPKKLAVLNEIIAPFVSSADATRKQYGQDLMGSLRALVRHRRRSTPHSQPPRAYGIFSERRDAEQKMTQYAETIRDSLRQGEQGHDWLSAGNLWPCLSPVALLELLRNDNFQRLEAGVKEALVRYGTLATMVQRLQRMHDASRCGDARRLLEEHINEGHSNWSPIDQPEWLLLEIDNNLLIRESQVDVARAIASPSSSTNSVLQMNMGQGKTSCIMPMAVTMLADKTQLCRLVVPRALLLQTALVIQRRIGRLVGREVLHIPFERRSPKSKQTLELYSRIHKDTLASGGVMLCLPEHVLSFQLSGIQQLADKDTQTAQQMMQIQEWIHRSSRDILDESDLTLSPKTQLIYPSGLPVIVDGHPHRWEVVQDLLALVEGHCSVLESRFKAGIQILRRHQGYPIIHFLNAKVADVLNELLVRDVCQGRLAHMQLNESCGKKGRKAVELIVSGADNSRLTWKKAKASLVDDTFGLKCLYLLRGLISERIILLCLKKRWNVQFGLHPGRAPIAVPFEAKGVPSQTAEYGHPDTTLVLTCLAFYQTGLSKTHIMQSLNHIIRADDPATQYEQWVQGCKTLPARARHVTLLSTDDEAQMEELWKCLRFDRHVLNHYMNNFVFPRHAKQFGVKLQASGWDIPLLSANSSPNLPSLPRLTTGFSGTNDIKRLLPQTIKQDDLAALVHTNAEVLGYLLEERNKKCYQAVDAFGQHLSERGLLKLLHDQGIRVLVDAGAHILEMENHDLALAWLETDYDAQGAVYFDRDGRVMVCARFQKSPVPLLASSFAESMEKCVVYIDEAHTRGTDLRLPLHAKGVVTLGMGQTKDQTVQAAMRLRQLGSTQSVSFVAPPEVHQSIVDLRSAHSRDANDRPVNSHDVVRWLLEQSCKANEEIMSLHIAQGFDFCRRANAMWKYQDTTQAKSFGNVTELIGAIRQREDQSIEELYESKNTTLSTIHMPLDFPKLQAFSSSLQIERLDLNRSGVKHDSSTLGEVEQEREVEFEVEQVREKQRQGQFEALSFPGLDEYISWFVETGELNLAGPFIQAFAFVGITDIGKKFGVRGTKSRLFVSVEFSKTIKGRPKTEPMAVRPVEWILWSKSTETALIVIPEEAELLLPKLQPFDKSCDEPRVWLLSYAAPVTKSMQLFNTLNFFTIPSQKDQHSFPVWLSLELGIIAGRLYFDYPEYKPLLSWLGVKESSGDILDPVDDSNSSSTLSPTVSDGLSIKKPLKFLLAWLTFRRETQDITHTPMGYVCQRRRLKPGHSFFISTGESSHMTDKTASCPLASGQSGEHTLESDDDGDWGAAEDEMEGMDEMDDMDLDLE